MLVIFTSSGTILVLVQIEHVGNELCQRGHYTFHERVTRVEV